jgi:LmbE family N-acetylglucosaminyl deacetylase
MTNNKTILIIAAHPDDELLGCGGSILKWNQSNFNVKVLYLSEGVSARSSINEQKDWNKEINDREIMAKAYAAAANLEIVGFMRKPNLRTKEIPMLDLVKEISNYIKKIKPNEIYTHFPGDMNSDHRVCFEAVLTACRPFSENHVEKLYSFEIPSSTNWSSSLDLPTFKPNHFIDIDSTITKKIEMLNYYKYEMREFPHPRSNENIKALAQIRGSDCGIKFAEGFMLIRSVSKYA